MAVTSADQTFYGSASSEYAGYGTAMGDLDDDGLDDVIVGARGYSSNTGHVGVYFGAGL